MAFVLQNDNGTVADANAYLSVAAFKLYHKDRGTIIEDGTGTIEDAIVEATDYLDSMYRFVGERQSITQRTQWPRIGAEDRNHDIRGDIPHEIEDACADLAFIALTSTLNPTPTRDATGQRVTDKSTKVGPIEKRTKYEGGGVYIKPRYPVADQRLFAAGLVVTGTELRRA